MLGCLQLHTGKLDALPAAPSPLTCSGPRLADLIDAADRDPRGIQFHELEFLEDSVEREVAKEGRACAWPPWPCGAEHVKSRRACFRAHADASGALGVTATGMYLLCRADVGNVPHSCLERVCRPGSAVRS